MSDLQVRGYIVSTTVNYLRETAGEQDAKRIFDELSPQLKHALTSVTPAGWYPVWMIAELNRVIASSLGKGEDDRARDALINCGKYMAREATNTFLRLLMRMLTPSLFAKKLPDLWQRDSTGGKLTVTVTDEKLECHIHDARGYDHVGPVAIGYAAFALESMGKVVEQTKLHSWSLAEPNVDGCWFELLWKV